MLEPEIMSATIGKLNIIYVVTTDVTLIPWYVCTLVYLDLGDFGLWVGHCRVGARAFPCVPSCVVVLYDVGAARAYSGTLLVHW